MKGFPKLKEKGKIYLVLLLVLSLLFVADFKLRSSLKEEKVLGANNSETGSEYPVFRKTFQPEISALGAVVMDADSKVVLYSKNPDLRFSSASTAKIMTALTGLDFFRLNDFLTVRDPSVEGTTLGLKSGQKITFENLLYGLLLPSANDTAVTIAQNFTSEEGFVGKMNQNASKFNLYNTHYQDPAGLEDDGDYTTPSDLARLSAIAIKNKIFAKIVSTKEKVITDTSGNEYQLKNLNKLLGVEDVDGIKTGTTTGAGQVLVTSKKEGNHTIIIVVMGSSDRFGDTQKLINLISGNITYLPIHL